MWFCPKNSVVLNLLYVWSKRTRQKKEKEREREKEREKEEEERLEIGKGNQMTALRFQTRGGRVGKSSDIPGLLSGQMRSTKPEKDKATTSCDVISAGKGVKGKSSYSGQTLAAGDTDWHR